MVRNTDTMMSHELDRPMPTLRWLRVFLQRYPKFAAGFAMGTGTLAIVSWWTGTGSLPMLSDQPRMTANTAALAILAGVTLWSARRAPIARGRRVVAVVCTAAICVVSGLTLLEYLTGRALGIDELLIESQRSGRPWPAGRPSPQTAAAFLLIGAALAAVQRGRQRPADYLALAAGAIAVGALLGYLFGVPLMYGVPSLLPYLGMSIPTALVVLAVSSGIIAARITHSILSVVIACDPGGVAARRMLAGLALFPPLAALLVAGSRAGWYALPIASALVLFAALAESSAFIVSTARRLSAADAASQRAIDALRVSEELVRTLVDQASDSIFVANLDGRYTDVNEAACRLLGYTRAELIGKRILDLIPPGEEARLAREKAAILEGTPRVSEWTLRRRDGSYVPVEVSAKVLADGRWQGFARDITERKRAEAALARAVEAERALRAELEAIAAASAAVSEAVAELPRAELDSVFRVIAEQARILTRAEYAAVGVGTDPEQPFERWITAGTTEDTAAAIGRRPHPVGMLGLISQSHEAIRVADLRRHPAFRGFPPGHPEMASLLAVPIHHRQRLVGSLFLANKRGAGEFSEYDERVVALLAERVAVAIETATMYALEATERAWLQSTIDQLPEGVILADEHGQLKALNRAITAMTGSSEHRDHVWSPSLFDTRDVHGNPIAFDEFPLIRALRGGEITRDREYVLRRPDGRMLPISANVVPIRGAGDRITGAVAVVTDISERKELDRQREEWVAVVAHDLRQPLNTILLSADRLLLLPRGANADKELAIIERVRGSAWRLNRMIDDLLDEARIAANQLAVEPRASDLVELARAAIDNARLASPTAAIRLVAPAHLLAWVDPDRVHQILTNLLSNALKYGAPDGEILVELARQDSASQVTVTNPGAEIPADDLGRLFTRFKRTQSAREARTPGIGLGLYICKGLVEAHGGQISAESEHGRTSFRFTLPEPPPVS